MTLVKHLIPINNGKVGFCYIVQQLTKYGFKFASDRLTDAEFICERHRFDSYSWRYVMVGFNDCQNELNVCSVEKDWNVRGYSTISLEDFIKKYCDNSKTILK